MVQRLENYRYKCDTVRCTEQRCTNREKFSLCSSRNYIAVADRCERHNFKIQVINERAPLSNGLLQRVGQEIVFESEHGQNDASRFSR